MGMALRWEEQGVVVSVSEKNELSVSKEERWAHISRTVGRSTAWHWLIMVLRKFGTRSIMSDFKTYVLETQIHHNF